MFSFLHSSKELYPYPRIRVRGLDKDARYSLSPVAGTIAPETPKIATGAYWMQYGFDPQLRGDFQAAAFVLKRIDRPSNNNDGGKHVGRYHETA